MNKYRRCSAKRRFLRLPRWIHQFYAFSMAYYWRPCKLCGKYYGGHESYGILHKTLTGGTTVCEFCAGEAERLNIERFGVNNC